MDLKNLSYELLSRMGLPHMQRRIFGGYVSIVMYHGVIRSPLPFYDWSFVEEGDFVAQMRYLKEHFNVIPLSDIRDAFHAEKNEKPGLVITFDDGYRNNFDVAFPVLRREGIPATMFLTTDFVDTEHTIWPFKLYDAVARTPRTEVAWNGDTFDVSSPDTKAKTLGIIKSRLKTLSQPEVASHVRDITSALGMDPEQGLPEGSPFRMLDRGQIRAMRDSGLIEFGAHTASHAILSRLSSEDQEKEISRSAAAVQDMTGGKCRLFAYPNGGAGDYGRETIRILKNLGIDTAVTTINGYNNIETPLLELRRYGIGSGMKMANFKLIVHHVIAVARQTFGRERIQAYGN